MKVFITTLLFVCLGSHLIGQTQLDIQGKSNSSSDVVNIQVNYTGALGATGINVYSEEVSGKGKGGKFYGGFYGVEGRSSSGYGIFGYSATNNGVNGFCNSGGAGVKGFANTGVGVIGDGGAYDFDAQGPGINYGTTSSRRWKRNIVNIQDPLGKISKLRGVYFDWDVEHGGKHDIGFIAEEIGEVIPEIVGYEDNGVDATGMDYSMMTPVLLEAANAMRKEYLEEIKTLKKENEELEKRLGRIERMLENQEMSLSQ